MKLKMWELYIGIQSLIQDEEGQDLIEYALVVALVALAATAGMQSLASGINNAFGSVANKLASYSS
ncbi:MAG: Flp family type IVb pilin [Acidobacteria bacterium]|nr:Flp family type IVb pilin [Acidobacteriota bacterium]